MDEVSTDIVGGGSDPVIVRVRGQIDVTTAPSLASAVGEGLQMATESDAKTLVVDLSDVEYCGSAAMPILTDLHRRAGTGVKLLVVAVGVVRRIFKVTGLDQLMAVEESVPPDLHPDS